MRKNIVQTIMAVEKMLRCLDRDLRKQCEELFGFAVLEGCDTESAFVMAAEAEAKRHVPITTEGQLVGVSGLRHAQRRSSAALAEFVRLPQQLKVVFDTTKQLGAEMNLASSEIGP